MGKNVFSLLRSKEIIAILDGDKEFGDMTFEDKYGNEKSCAQRKFVRSFFELFRTKIAYDTN